MPKYWAKINDNVEGPYEQHVLQYLDGFTPETLVSLDEASMNEIWIKASEIHDLYKPFSGLKIKVSMDQKGDSDLLDTTVRIEPIKDAQDDTARIMEVEIPDIPITKFKEQTAETKEIEESLGKLSGDSLDKLTETSYDDIVLHPESISIDKDAPPKSDQDLIKDASPVPETPPQEEKVKPPKETKTSAPIEESIPRYSEENFSTDKLKEPKKEVESSLPQNEEDIMASDMLDLMGKIDQEMGIKRDQSLDLKIPVQEPPQPEPEVPVEPAPAPTPTVNPDLQQTQSTDISINPSELIGKPDQSFIRKSRDVRKPVFIFCGIIILACILYFGYITGIFDKWIASAKSMFSKEKPTTIQKLHEENPIKKIETPPPAKLKPIKKLSPIKPKKPVAKKKPRVRKKPKPVVKKEPPKRIKLESQKFVLPGVPSPQLDSEKLETTNPEEVTVEEVQPKKKVKEKPVQAEKKPNAQEQFDDLEWMDTSGWGQ